MRRPLTMWRSWSVRQRAAGVGAVVLAVAAIGLVGYLIVKRPGDVLNRNAPFAAQRPAKHVAQTVNWPVYGYNAARVRYLPSSRVDPPFRTPRWTFHTGGTLLEFPPIFVNGVLYVMDDNTIFDAINAATGKLIWKNHVGGLGAASPAYYQGRLFGVLLKPGLIVALDAKKGHVLWRRHIPTPGSESSPVVYDGKVLVGCQCGNVYALDPRTGRTDWSVDTGGSVKGAVAAHDGVAFAGNYAGHIYAISVATGKVRWRADALGGGFLRGGGIYSTPAVAFGRVYIGGLDHRVYSFEEKTGKLAWSHSTGREVYASPAVADLPGIGPTIYIGSLDGNFYALNARNGGVRWQQSAGGEVVGSASVIGSTVYVSVIGRGVTLGFDAKSGNQVFLSHGGEYTPAISDGQVLYVTEDSTISAYDPKSPANQRGRSSHRH